MSDPQRLSPRRPAAPVDVERPSSAVADARRRGIRDTGDTDAAQGEGPEPAAALDTAVPSVDAAAPVAAAESDGAVPEPTLEDRQVRSEALLAASIGLIGIGGAGAASLLGGDSASPQAVDRPRPEEGRPTSETLRPDPPKTDEPKPEQPKPDQPKPDEPKPDRPKPDEPKPDEPKPDQPRPDEPKPDRPKPEEPKPDEPKPDQTKPDAPTLSLAADTGRSDRDLVTSSGAVKVSGLEAGATLAVSLDGGKTWTARGGDALLPDSLFGADGEQHLAVKQIDAAGNASAAAELSFVLDRVAPDAPRWAMPAGKPALGSADVITMQGVEPGAVVEYRMDAAAPWLVAKDGRIPVSQFPRDFSARFEARQTDAAGNVSAISTLVADIDVSAPAAPSLSLRNDTGLSDRDLVTSSGSVNVSGLEAGTTLSLSLDGGKTWTSRGGDALLPESLFGGDGEKHLSIKQIDAAGNESAAADLSFVLDRTAPGPLRWAMPAGKPALGLSDTIAPLGVEPGARVDYRLDATSPWQTAQDGKIPMTIFHRDGAMHLDVRQTDLAGNVGASTTLTVDVDVTPPSAPKVALFNDTGVSSADGITASGVVSVSGLEAGTRLLASAPGKDWQECTAGATLVDLGLSDGRQNLQFKQVDAAGNASAVTSLSFTLDKTALKPNWISSSKVQHLDGAAGDQVVLNGRDDITISLNDIGAGRQDSLSYRVDGGPWRPAPVDGRLPSATFGADGKHLLELRESDLAGNEGFRRIEVTVDTTPPAAPTLGLFNDNGSNTSDRVTSDGRVSISGPDLMGLDFQSRVNGGAWVDEHLGTADPRRYVNDSYDGTVTLEVRFIDAAGNVGAISSLSFTQTHSPI